jgi:hypothetical protein
MKHFRRKRGLGILAYLVVFAVIVATVMYLWNILLPGLFGIASINYWQSAGLIILSRLLFGGFGKFHHKFHHGCHSFSGAPHINKESLVDLHHKIKGMSPCERSEFIRRRIAGLDEEDEKN